MEELEVLLKEQEQQQITIGNYKSMIKGYSTTIEELQDQLIDLKTDYNDTLKEYDAIKNSKKAVDQMQVDKLKAKMARLDTNRKNISSNLQSNKLDRDTAKASLKAEEFKNKTLQKQIADHPEAKLVSAEEKEKRVKDMLQNTEYTKARLGKILEGEIKSIDDIPDDIKQKLFKDDSTLARYDKELDQLNTDLTSLKNSNAEPRLIKSTEQKIKTIENRKLSFAIDELKKTHLAADVAINSCHSHIKNLTREKNKAYDDIDAIHNGTYKQPENDEHSDNDNKGSQSKDDDEKFKDDENDEKAKTGLPIKPSFFNRFKNKLSEIINKVKEHLPKSKAKKEQEEKEAEEQRKQEEEQKQKEEQEQKEKEEKEKEQNENKNQKTNNRHYEANDFRNNQNFKNDMDEFLKNFEARTRKDLNDFEKDYDDNSFNR
jgi:DNA ligase 1